MLHLPPSPGGPGRPEGPEGLRLALLTGCQKGEFSPSKRTEMATKRIWTPKYKDSTNVIVGTRICIYIYTYTSLSIYIYIYYTVEICRHGYTSHMTP